MLTCKTASEKHITHYLHG